jgi:hypothetical protein
MQNILIAIVVGFVVGTASGFIYEQEKFVAYKAQAKGITEAQMKVTDDENLKNKGDANDAKQQSDNALAAKDAYYRDHPAIRFVAAHAGGVSNCNGSGTVPRPADNPQVADGAPTGSYVSPYDPSDTETVAITLDALQTRLQNAAEHGGVKIE